jgi:F0F1-type ATP synthase membrane subunit b/b'
MSGEVSAGMDFLGKVVNALVLFGGLAFVLRKPLKAMLMKRTVDIGESIRLAETGLTEAEAKAAESRNGLAGLEGEVRGLKAEAEEAEARSGAHLARRRRWAARLKFTRQELDEQLRRASASSKPMLPRGPHIARERIRERLTPETQAALQ